MERIMELSKSNKALICAYKKGYRVKKDGSVKGLRKNSLKLSIYNGYYKFNVKMNGNSFSIKVHRLVAYQKYGEKLFKEGIQVRHLNNNKRDNSFSNISIGTASENALDKPKKTRRRASLIAGLSRSSLTEEDVKRIRYLREEEKWRYSDILKEYPMAKSTLSLICNYKTWIHI
jgi:hypothetical protein